MDDEYDNDAGLEKQGSIVFIFIPALSPSFIYVHPLVRFIIKKLLTVACTTAVSTRSVFFFFFPQKIIGQLRVYTVV